MELTRRDALAALAASGTLLGGTIALTAKPHSNKSNKTQEPTDPALNPQYMETAIDIASIIYPSQLTGLADFVSTYLNGRLDDSDYKHGFTTSIDRLNDLSIVWHDAKYVNLTREVQETVLHEIGADTADPAPSGSPGSRIRYYLINELLYALYTSPTGGRLVGIENPQGHPGGIKSYQLESPK